jgi:L-threonylcarbamoyladenylate synthase
MHKKILFDALLTRNMNLTGASPSEMGRIVNETRDLLRRGGTVVYPTDTAYGLGAHALQPEAVRRVFREKNRSPDKPVSLCVSSEGQLTEFAEYDERIELLIQRLLPGPYTLVLRGKFEIPGISLDGKIAIRIPDHQIALALCEGLPLTATSANLAGRPSPRRIQEVTVSADVVLDAGPTRYEQDSTIVDLTSQTARILRKGAGEIPVLARALKESGLALE